jgi:hypothetical protein
MVGSAFVFTFIAVCFKILNSSQNFFQQVVKGGGSLSAEGCLYFIFDPNWSKFGVDIQEGPTKSKEELFLHFFTHCYDVERATHT